MSPMITSIFDSCILKICSKFFPYNWKVKGNFAIACIHFLSDLPVIVTSRGDFCFSFDNFSGQTYTQFSKIAEAMNLMHISSTLFYLHQRSYVVPAVDNLFASTVLEARGLIRSQGNCYNISTAMYYSQLRHWVDNIIQRCIMSCNFLPTTILQFFAHITMWFT